MSPKILGEKLHGKIENKLSLAGEQDKEMETERG